MGEKAGDEGHAPALGDCQGCLICLAKCCPH